jgi:uncharacterized protein (TIGR02001 family)
MRHLTKLIGALAMAGSFAGSAHAQDTAPDVTASGTFTIQSDYRYRGISQNSKEVAPQAAATVSFPAGFYVSAWASKVNWGGNNPSYELDLFGGKHFDLDGTDLNVMAYYYSYPDYRPGAGPAASYYETIAQLTHNFGPIAVTVTGSNSPNWSLDGGTGWYLAGLFTVPVTDWLSFSANVGHQWVEKAPSDYTHFDIGATATYRSWSLDVRYASTDIGNAACGAFWMATPNACSGGFVATINYNVADFFK